MPEIKSTQKVHGHGRCSPCARALPRCETDHSVLDYLRRCFLSARVPGRLPAQAVRSAERVSLQALTQRKATSDEERRDLLQAKANIQAHPGPTASGNPGGVDCVQWSSARAVSSLRRRKRTPPSAT